ncbi:PREDICTED: cationic peroxidase 1-like [Nelumbo nucifera]|uniref:Peroxidase n=1 Tax=Nelumbo nucifera TaxID=4432 RepID=A0A1U8AGG0_NELNU|nr:PREDICTED: cationic peroxidase 1-like [Nelumbo nucifera]
MAFSSLITLFSILLFLMGMASGQLSSSNFYATSCPTALSTIQSEVNSAVARERRMGASLLRLHFHDCFVTGCDASLLLDDDSTTGFTGEKTAAPNLNSVRGYEVIDAIKTKLETTECPGVVSCADILAVAARDAVVALGGTSWTVQLGRRDSTTANFALANSGGLPFFDSDLSTLIKNFTDKGFTETEFVALSGAHSVGLAKCLTFRNRIDNDANIDSTFHGFLKSTCDQGGDGFFHNLDNTTDTTFDNAYFTNLLDNKGLLHSDQELFSGGSTDAQVRAYSTNSAAFFSDFGNAMIKMGSLDVSTGTAGQIRTNCRKVNT